MGRGSIDHHRPTDANFASAGGWWVGLLGPAGGRKVCGLRAVVVYTLGCLIVLPGRKSSILGGLDGTLLPQHPLEKVGGFAPHLFQLCGRRGPFRPKHKQFPAREGFFPKVYFRSLVIK